MHFCFTFFLCLQMFRSSVAFAIALISTTFQQENPGVYLKIEENSFLVHDHNNAIGNERAQSLSACSMICTRQELCQSANFIPEKGVCLLYKDVNDNIYEPITIQGSFYIEKVRICICGTIHIFFHIFFHMN